MTTPAIEFTPTNFKPSENVKTPKILEKREKLSDAWYVYSTKDDAKLIIY
jgi:hypothetical protein